MEFVGRRGTDPVTERVLDLWGRTLKAVQSQDLSAVDTEIDWVIKKKLIDAYAARAGLDMTHPRIAQIDLTYHDVRAGRGLHSLLVAKGRAAQVVTEDQIIEATTVPPQTTRATAPRQVRRGRAGRRPRLHRGLGAPQTQRPGPAHGAAQGPVPGHRRSGDQADRGHVAGPHRRDPEP